ncbi:N-6 DNA methylase [Marinobacter hydrocarbonoclasticus]|nr:N-6 DNA methylase [Marinobacter nauticus]
MSIEDSLCREISVVGDGTVLSDAKSKRDAFSQFYTMSSISDSIAANVEKLHCYDEVLDLGCGQGSLLHAVRQKNPTIKLVGVDIDPDNINHCRAAYGKNSHFEVYDALDVTQKKPNILNKSYDLIVGNPPFRRLKNNIFLQLEKPGLGDFLNGGPASTELFFLNQCLELLSDNGTLAIILPDGVISSERNKWIRKYLCSTYNLQKIIEVPPKSFSGTEAKTHIVFIKKETPSKGILIGEIRSGAKLVISPEQFIRRGDYSFYNKPFVIHNKKLSDIVECVFRGNIEYTKEARSRRYEGLLHTTSLDKSVSRFSNNLSSTMGKRELKTNDIVISRVGSRSMGKLGIIEKGRFFATDCLFVIRPICSKSSISILQYLCTESAQMWLRQHSKGVGARYITLEDLRSLPVPDIL